MYFRNPILRRQTMKTLLPIINGTGLFDSRNRFSHHKLTPCRTAKEFEIELFISNSGIAHINGVAYPISRGSVLVARPNDLRQTTPHVKCHFIHFVVHDQMIVQFINSLPRFFEVPYEECVPFFDDILKSFISADETSNICSVGLLLQLLYYLKQKPRFKTLRQDNLPQMDEALSLAVNFIHANYSHEITVEKIAEQCNLSTSYLFKLFQHYLHVTPMEYASNLRLENAKKLLLSDSLSISDVALTCGFSSQSYFSYFFKKRTGMSPGQFRKNAKYPK